MSGLRGSEAWEHLAGSRAYEDLTATGLPPVLLLDSASEAALSRPGPADAVQTFPLPADLPLGRYLRVNLHGKRQRQLEDMQASWRVPCGVPAGLITNWFA